MTRIHRLQGPGFERVTVIAAITGLSSDAALVRDELEARPASKVLLGVPYEDLDAIRATSGTEQQAEFDAGELDEVYLKKLGGFAPVQSPPPDLYVAYRFAQERNIPVEAIDLGDEAYTEAYTKNVGIFEVLRSNRHQRRVPSLEFESKDADAFVREWDETLNAGKGVRKVQQAREEKMAQAIASAARSPGVVAIIPLSRAQGILARLARAGWSPG